MALNRVRLFNSTGLLPYSPRPVANERKLLLCREATRHQPLPDQVLWPFGHKVRGPPERRAAGWVKESEIPTSSAGPFVQLITFFFLHVIWRSSRIGAVFSS